MTLKIKSVYRCQLWEDTLLRDGLTDGLEHTGIHNGNVVSISRVSVALSFRSFTSGRSNHSLGDASMISKGLSEYTSRRSSTFVE